MNFAPLLAVDPLIRINLVDSRNPLNYVLHPRGLFQHAAMK
jgi:hypothetical protein